MSESPNTLSIENVVALLAANEAKVSLIYDILLRGLPQDDQNKVEALLKINTIKNSMKLLNEDNEYLQQSLKVAEDEYAAILKEIDDRPLMY